ncbi:MAG: hypothetical protein AAGF56_06975 [Pseudomonadota bacterium]
MQAAHIEVTISAELRQLVRDGQVGVPRIGRRDATGAAAASLPPVRAQATTWQDVVLRRDGGRPLRFTGLPVVRFAGPTLQHAGGWQIACTLYTGQSGRVFLAISATGPDDQANRPVHCATEVALTTGPAALANCLCAVLQTITLNAPQKGDQSDVLLQTFNRLTHGTFRRAIESSKGIINV